jgi:hypothetical protein
MRCSAFPIEGESFGKQSNKEVPKPLANLPYFTFATGQRPSQFSKEVTVKQKQKPHKKKKHHAPPP